MEKDNINFRQYLVDKGYETFRYIKQGDKLDWRPTTDSETISSMVFNGVAIKFVKEDSAFLYGLCFQGLPPTLLTPSPNTSQEQSKMIDFISKNTNEIIFENYYPHSIVK